MTNYGKLYPVSFGIAWGIVAGLGYMILCWAAMRGFGLDMMKVMGGVYPGMNPSFTGGLWGFFWGFVNAFFIGFLIALIYNCSCISFCCSSNCGASKK